MAYNTQLSPLILKAYGREVQEMIQQAIALENREERTAMAYRIVEVMKILTQQTRANQEEIDKLWNHLAQMAEYRLEIDYPCHIVRHIDHQTPTRLTYPKNRIRLRHYGRLLQSIVEQIGLEEDADLRKDLIRTAASRMKRNLADTQSDVPDTRRLAHDIAYYTDGAVSTQEVEAALGKIR